MARVFALVAIASLVACKDNAVARPDPSPPPPPSAAALTKAVTLTSAERASVRRIDDSASAALRIKDRAKLLALGADSLDLNHVLLEVSDTECLGDAIEEPGPYDALVVRHSLGFKSEQERTGGRCEGVHEIHMHYTLINGEARLLSVNRWGW